MRRGTLEENSRRLRNYRHVYSLLTGVVAVGAASAAKSLQSCPTLCDPKDGSPPDSRIPGILQARTREWVAISFSNAWKWRVKVKSLSCVRLFATPRTAAHQAPLSMGFSSKSTGVGCHCLLGAVAADMLYSLTADPENTAITQPQGLFRWSLYMFTEQTRPVPKRVHHDAHAQCCKWSQPLHNHEFTTHGVRAQGHGAREPYHRHLE